MKKLLFLIPILLIGFIIFTGQKSTDNLSEKWDLDPSMTQLVVTGPSYPVLPSRPVDYVFSTKPRFYNTPFGIVTVTPNVRVHPTTNTNQSEVIIVRHPLNQNIMFASCNMTTIGSPLFISEGVYVTTNGGLNWFGSDSLQSVPVIGHGGDPGPTIDKNGRFIMTHLGYLTSGMYANYSTNNGLNWSSTYTIATGPQDKNLAGSDDEPTSPFYGRSYCVWTPFTSTVKPIAVSFTSNGGVSWSAPQNINNPPSPYRTSQGCDVRVGPGGTVYVTWRDHGGSPFTGKRVGLGKSTNGGVNWTVTKQAFAMNGVRDNTFGTYGIRVPDFPRIDIDKTGGPRHGWIYIVTNEYNLAPAGSDADVVINASSDGGATWPASLRKRVNQDPMNNGKLQFFPAIRVDEFGGVNIVYYDNRNTASDSAEVYVARSMDGGSTWTELLVSDHRFKPTPIAGLANYYSGDYIGITSGNAKIWPVWMDNSTGTYQEWTAGIIIANYPLNSFNLQTPSSGVTITSFPNSSTPVTFTWDTSATGASYKWIFGTSLPTRQITQQSSVNSLTMTLGQLDIILAGLGVQPGNQLVGAWDVWAFRPNPPQNDSLKAANGPRAVTLKRGVPVLSAFNLSSPPTGTQITTSPFNDTLVNMKWTRSGDGTTYKWKFGSPTISTPLITLNANGSGYDSLLSIKNSSLDSVLASVGVLPGGMKVGQWAVWAYNGSDSLKSSQTWAMTLRRAAISVLFYDPFSTGTGKWTITNDGGTCVWQIFSTPYPNNYTLPPTSSSPVFSADADECGSGTTLRSTATVANNINCVGYENISLEFDNDWNAIDAQDQAIVEASYNGGSTWVTIISWGGTDVRNTHEVKPLPGATNIPNLKIRFKSIQPGWDWWWTIDNVTIKGDLVTGVANNEGQIPKTYALWQNYPNPFNPTTKISFDLPKPGFVTLKIYDILGKEVANLVNEVRNAGRYNIEFNGGNLSSGVYYYRIQAGEFMQVKKMVLIK